MQEEVANHNLLMGMGVQEDSQCVRCWRPTPTLVSIFSEILLLWRGEYIFNDT